MSQAGHERAISPLSVSLLSSHFPLSLRCLLTVPSLMVNWTSLPCEAQASFPRGTGFIPVPFFFALRIRRSGLNDAQRQGRPSHSGRLAAGPPTLFRVDRQLSINTKSRLGLDLQKPDARKFGKSEVSRLQLRQTSNQDDAAGTIFTPREVCFLRFPSPLSPPLSSLPELRSC
jgi:hypothetical protein